MVTIKQILGTKGRDIWSVDPAETVYQAISLMAEKRVGALLVMESSQLVGIISERDYAREIILKGRASRDTPVRDIMSREVITITLDHRVEDSLAVMTEQRVRHLPVLDQDRVVGVVSIGDLVKEIIREQQSTIEHLENYIRG